MKEIIDQDGNKHYIAENIMKKTEWNKDLASAPEGVVIRGLGFYDRIAYDVTKRGEKFFFANGNDIKLIAWKHK